MRLKNDKPRYNKRILVKKSLLKQNLRDTRNFDFNNGLGNSFGKLNSLIARFQLKTVPTADGESVEIVGSRENLQRLLFYIHFSGVDYKVVEN